MLLTLNALTTGCKKSESSETTATAPPPEVVVVKAIAKDVPDYRYYPAITQAVLKADIVARVEGYLEERNFVGGTDVEAGQRLYLIQQDQYELELANSVAALAEAKANLAFQRFNRNETANAFSKGAASEYEMDQAQAQYESSEAQAASAEADILNAELNLSYTDVVAPFAGRVGHTQVDVGNLVGPSMNTTLTTLVTLDPMRVIFEPSANHLTDFFSAKQAGQVDVQVTVAGVDGQSKKYDGVLDLINNEVDQQTSTFLARAVFPNTEKLVLPGMYVNLRIKLRMLPNTIVVPQDAVRSEPRDQYVFIVTSDNEIQRQIVTTGSAYEGFRIIKSGLKVGQQVIVQGDPTKVKASVKVTPKLEDANAFVKDSNAKALTAATLSGGADADPATDKTKQGKTQKEPVSGKTNSDSSKGDDTTKATEKDGDGKSSSTGAGST